MPRKIERFAYWPRITPPRDRPGWGKAILYQIETDRHVRFQTPKEWNERS